MYALSDRYYLAFNTLLSFSIVMSFLFYIGWGLEDMRAFLNFCFFLEKIFPPYSGIAFTILFFSIVGIYGFLVGGNTRLSTDMLGYIYDFSIEKIRIIGNVETSEVDIIRCLGVNWNKSLISFDAAIVQNNLLKLPWISHAEIHRIYPNTIEIRIKERDPYAIWQRDANFFLIDKDGDIIESFSNAKFSYLPKLIGKGVNREIKSFAKLLEFSEIAKLVKAYNWIAERRWDMHLQNGIVVNLPEEKFSDALFKLLELQNKYKIFDRDISVIDMRIPDRITIRLTVGSFIDRQSIIDLRKKILDKVN
ncbi:MAG: cell division protein [Candidatus Liberibacter europaeus]|uniref:Cell division protein FtsQ n=1 Tax=Candidatus Liberibacter europaeus TaxID=744859 RepID=A0A2T4VWR0_9HYPH|nr:cell division protein [Candidatus Liberibacter europaeus]PTL86211.1 MAG: cell division protein [Candidatus Liberibacter europaeus]